MGKRGPKARGSYASKGSTLSARITIETRTRLDEASRTSGLSLSAEVEKRLRDSFVAEKDRPRDSTAGAFLEMILQVFQNASNVTGQDWLSNAYTFELAVSAVAQFLMHFRPEGAATVPETMKMVSQLPPDNPLRREFLEKLSNQPTDLFATPIANGIVAHLQQAKNGVRIPDPENPDQETEEDRRKRRQWAVERLASLYPFISAAPQLAGLVTEPVLPEKEDEPRKGARNSRKVPRKGETS